MWYNTIPAVSLSPWLSNVLSLFNHIFSACLAQPFFHIPVGCLLLLVLFSLFHFLLLVVRRR